MASTDVKLNKRIRNEMYHENGFTINHHAFTCKNVIMYTEIYEYDEFLI